MVDSTTNLNGVNSRLLLVFPPEVIHGHQCYCRFEPDGIAMLKGFLQVCGYPHVDLVFASHPRNIKEENEIKNPSGWGISPFNQEGISFRHVVRSGLHLDLESPLACSLKEFLPFATLDDASIIGFSIGFPSQLYHALILARIARQLNPDIFVIFGGPLITSHISFVATLGELTPFIDGIIPGYGEEPLAQLIFCLHANGDLKQVPNLYLPLADEFVRNPTSWQPNKTHLLTIPDYGRGSLERKLDPYFPLRPSIGCYWGRCAFCVYPSMPAGTRGKQRYTVLKPAELVSLITTLINGGSGYKFELCSDALPPSYLKDLAKEILKSNLKINWNAWSCVDKAFLDDDVLHVMKRSGCDSVLLGVESANQKILDRMHKIHCIEDIDPVLNAFFAAGINIFATLCIGFPGEKYDEGMETITYLRSLKARNGDFIETRLYRFALMCNTPIVNDFKRHNISSIDFSDMYQVDDDFGYRYEVTEGMGFDETRDLAFRWRSSLDIGTDDSQLQLVTALSE